MPIQLDAIEQARSTIVELAIRFGPKLVVAILIMVAGGPGLHSMVIPGFGGMSRSTREAIP